MDDATTASAGKFRFRIRTSAGWRMDRLVLHGRDAAHAEAKLRRMYPRCEIVSVEACALTAKAQHVFELYRLAQRGLLTG